MTRIICDASALISMSENCLLCILRNLNNELIITPSVEQEIVKDPYRTKRFKLKSIQLNQLIKEGVIKVSTHPKLKDEADLITKKANEMLEMNGKRIRIMHQGEAETIALCKLTNADAILVDERTARHLIEKPEKIRDYMQSRMKRKIKINKKIMDEITREIGNINVIRSAELISYSYEKQIMSQCKMENALEAALYAVKFAGCSITEEEIKEYVKMLG